VLALDAAALIAYLKLIDALHDTRALDLAARVPDAVEVA
jgi:hypothetical protein